MAILRENVDAKESFNGEVYVCHFGKWCIVKVS
jgi:hypothetical protein